MKDAKTQLEAFVVNNKDLDRLESLLAEFNIFEAIGVVRQELRHSDFLAFLLDPRQNHGLGDIFLKRFLKNVLSTDQNPPVNVIEIDVANLSGAVVQREWQKIDILIHLPEYQIICAIENKVDSGEHTDQLKRYRQVIGQEYPDHRHIFIFLSPEGYEPSDDEYIPFDYGEITRLLDDLHQAHASTLGADVATLITHYTTMLRRHIMDDSEIAELCQKIYRQHKEALDLIIEHRPDLQTDISAALANLIQETNKQSSLTLWYESKRYVEFYPIEWENLPTELVDKGWEIEDMPLIFQFKNSADSLKLRLRLISDYPRPILEAILAFVLAHPNVFPYATAKIGSSYTQLYRKEFLKAKDYEDADFDTLQEKIETAWQKFLTDDLPAILQTLDQIDWTELKKS